MLWFLRGFGAVCALLLAGMMLHSFKPLLSKKKRLWTFVHSITAAVITAYTISELALGWMYLSRPTRIFCAACWGLLSLCCLLSAILEAFTDPDKPYPSFRRFNHDLNSLLMSLLVALLPLIPASLYITL